MTRTHTYRTGATLLSYGKTLRGPIVTDLTKITSQCDVLRVSHSVFSFPLKYKVGKTNFFITVDVRIQGKVNTAAQAERVGPVMRL